MDSVNSTKKPWLRTSVMRAVKGCFCFFSTSRPKNSRSLILTDSRSASVLLRSVMLK